MNRFIHLIYLNIAIGFTKMTNNITENQKRKEFKTVDSLMTVCCGGNEHDRFSKFQSRNRKFRLQ